MYDNTAKNLETAVSGRPDTEIEGCLNRANNALERLNGRVNAIEDRLRPVMRVSGTGAQVGAAKAPHEALSPLGDAIRSVESRVDGACDRLEVLLLGLAL